VRGLSMSELRHMSVLHFWRRMTSINVKPLIWARGKDVKPRIWALGGLPAKIDQGPFEAFESPSIVEIEPQKSKI